jgi:hypothetical protein
VSGCSAPRTRARTGISAASWSRAQPDHPPARSTGRAWPAPRDRRETFLAEFTATIAAETSSLAGTLPALRASLRATPDKQERAAIREQISQGTARLAYLQALPAFTADAMCSECPCWVPEVCRPCELRR